ncbi:MULTISPECIES: pyruvate, phosphate dikinase [Desulfococcus]|uniref:Pyruvate, phosphate dikinase n=1 Tax=Desulfococcus multivorans DSM 2059 TaxID=1121405 RepID=S7V9D7_DESML|nr:pyruvate, phosphate dikinase [Desulfococcus multivorans]AOY58509.1 PpdK: pyruvate, phosphate dikinase [Desulfococcus multivorans]AQV00823.1 pyruvate, phosphate dikinase [Desulfococcus multivorans]EPR43294.1 pyruvate, phosphate dikinase [Desulfococcus multivorans DSM 2059]SJZ42242.1 pyruvate phosphate dikinase [Desulfococcus multivorans DSM 2059]
MTKKWVYLFDEVEAAEKYAGGTWDGVRSLLGGKGANLAEMARIGVPVPPGFTVTTEACNAYLASGGKFPEGLWEQELEALKAIERNTGKVFGDAANPLLVSCRSGAKFSMPGMMDTVLNIGLNDETAKGMVELTGDERFVYDAYRRLVQMFGNVVMGVPDDLFEEVITDARMKEGVETDAELSAEAWKTVTREFQAICRRQKGYGFPRDPFEQLRLATEAVFKSWNGKRAVDYRNAAGISHDLGTAVSIVTMVFGNMGDDSATGVAMTRNGSTGERQIEGDYLTNAQGEDVVAGIRLTKDLSELEREMPVAYAEFEDVARKLEQHYREMQDVEFTIEKGKLWMLQTRDGKRTAQAAVRIAVDMAEENLISREDAVLRVTPEQVDFFLHPQFDRKAVAAARASGTFLGSGLNVSPGAACGVVALDADLAEKWSKEGKDVVMVRPETKPDDVHGMLAARGILTSRGGRTSHAALVARQFGKPAVVGVSELQIDMNRRQMRIKDEIVHEGDWISIDGTVGELFLGKLSTTVPDIRDPWLIKLLSWADEFRTLGVWTNADYPKDALRAREYGAEGIGLCRSEHMFFEAERLPYVLKMIMTDLPIERREALEAVLPFQREDFAGLFRAMDGLPVIIRLLDPPLHEFLPNHVDLRRALSDIKIRLQHADNLEKIDELLQQFKEKEQLLKRAESLHEANPMLGMRGVRLGILVPEITTMQVRAIFEAACIVAKEGVEVHPEVMIPLTAHVNELKVQRRRLEAEARQVMTQKGQSIDYKFGTMIELPRAALTADQIAEHAEFFSYGTNDLTQTTYGISRDDAEAGFLIDYIEEGILPDNPFATIDEDGVGQLMKIGIEKGRSVRPDLECGICGEHGGDPASIALCHKLGLTYVSCSPFRVPVARLAAAHAAIMERRGHDK